VLPTIDVISLERRPGRLERTARRLDAHGLPWSWFPAVDGGWRGCKASHTALWQQAVSAGKTVAIMEDDVAFVPRFPQRLRAALAELPDDWDVVFLGGHSSAEPTWCGRTVARVRSVMWTHAYLARPEALAYSLDAVREIDAPLDYAWAGRMAPLRVYRAWPWLVGQQDGWSDVTHGWSHGRNVLASTGPKTTSKEGTWPSPHGSD
jgi:GR25 family glycosyltransferase involved in LPS biosynthesis